MMELPDDRRYTKEHEWVKVDGDVATVGITEFAQSELGDVTYIETPAVGAHLAKGDAFGVVESVKAVSDVYAPVSGEVVAVNSALADAPETVNASPYDGAWMIKLRVANPAELDDLLDAAGYEQVVRESH
ncbi:MAG TPA: glycine cleavage system protein GcvH [Thermomicrobiales bacterium]|jgi:glycine cleavage system H protein|nr:glycine cleavage system protein GcvH [Thermomicrobiales bacterium]